MQCRRHKAALGISILLMACCSLRGQKPAQATRDSCLGFTQTFYNWYVAHALKSANLEPWIVALRYEGGPFSKELAQALLRSESEAEAEGDAVLDFDPILNTQDPADRYAVRNIVWKDGHWWANVYGVWSRPVPHQGKGPQVIAELDFKNGRWLFLNFHYPNSTNPNNENLLSILRFQYHKQ